MRTFRALLVVFLVLFVARAAAAQYFGQNKVQYRRFDFQVLQTRHFDIYYYPSEQDAVYQAARMAERWYDHLSRVIGHQLHDRQPLVLYACHPDFAQTNVVAESPGEGTGGFTESDRNRVVLPFGASLAETNHVLGHELVHAFQYDIARHGNAAIVMMPLWFIEGMAEYLSIGGMDSQTAMWMRDAVSQNKLPDIKDLADPRFFPYRYGQAIWSYLADRFGPDVVPKLLRARGEKVATRLKAVTGLTAAQISKDWHESLRAQYKAPKVADAGAPKVIAASTVTSAPGGVHRIITAKTAGRLNVGPALSPDGNQVVFLSEKDRFSVDLFVADAHTGRVERKIVSTATDPHFDSLEFIDSAGAWDPTGRRFAFTAIRGGGAVLVLIDARAGSTIAEARLGDIGQAFNATWSPDGRRLAFSGLKGGVTDLYEYDVDAGAVTALTHDVFADFQPSWSPDGKTIAFVTDRFSTDLRNLEFGNYSLARLDVATGAIDPLPGLRDARNLDPHWSPDGRSLFFVSDAGGVNNIYRLEIATSQIRKVTDLWNGVAGVTPMSPVMSVAADHQAIAFSVYRDGGYEIDALDSAAELAGQLLPSEATTMPGVVPLVDVPARPAPLADDTLTSLGDAAVKRYRKTLSLNRVGQPYFSAGGGSYGTFIQAGVGLSWADMLGDQQMDLQLQVGRRRDDFAGQAVYVNRSRRVNVGFVLDYLPALFARSEATFISSSDTATRQTDYLRQIHTGASGLVIYPFNRARRLEFAAGLEHVSFARETDQQVFSLTTGNLLREENSTVRAAEPITFGQFGAAFVEDTAVWGPTSPILGSRYRFEVAPAMGNLSFTTVLGDYRRYVMPFRPFTLAMRARYISRFGRDASDPRLLPLVLTLRDQVRGYDLQSMVAAPCSDTTGYGCTTIDVLDGSRLFVGNIEVRFPLLGVLNRSFSYGKLPLEGLVFLDAGSLWTRQSTPDGGVWSRHLMRSAGAGVRVNAGGMVFELDAVRPFDRPDTRGWTVSFNIVPGF